MAKTKEEKKKIIDKLADDIKKSEMITWLKLSGFPTNAQNDLKSQLKKANSGMSVIKKTLIDIALKKSGIKDINVSEFRDTVGFVFIDNKDFASVLKIVYNFQKEYSEVMEIIGGYDKNRLYSAEEIINLAKLPPREVLLSKLVFSLNSPISNFVYVLKGNLFNLVRVLNRVKEKKVEGLL